MLSMIITTLAGLILGFSFFFPFFFPFFFCQQQLLGEMDTLPAELVAYIVHHVYSSSLRANMNFQLYNSLCLVSKTFRTAVVSSFSFLEGLSISKPLEIPDNIMFVPHSTQKQTWKMWSHSPICFPTHRTNCAARRCGLLRR